MALYLSLAAEGFITGALIPNDRGSLIQREGVFKVG